MKVRPLHKGVIYILLILTGTMILAGCSRKQDASKEETELKEQTYIEITQSEAKEMMNSEEKLVILDVRTDEEFMEGHIENAILLPVGEITDRAEEMLPDKDKKILVYCHSGRRSKVASYELAELGYTNVFEFGGIIDWKYDIVK
ncbi:MAG TPA: rhodanese-like domain-containing protein [Lachnoclostridium phytofermentans]|uniref:Rhodanese-like domain-containing protein n=1 Tax=Lachnoclostridium phytofermentans TaxID=66219 RepID=A0A3D2X587_9FIRM|nr:rhodanese-like domain-containing protein [Lachnoclostridium sp.]HCL01725.1 rhodanese-like domain-containing protein [Lachnoclostridium phytofermentans]